MAKDDLEPVLIDDAEILFPNFEGRESTFNASGKRNFHVVIDEATAKRMIQDGWNIKERESYGDEGGDITYTLAVSVNMNSRKPPKITMISSRGRTQLDADTLKILDQVDIVKADLIINPYFWDVQGNKGIKAYLKTMYVTIYEDELQLRYSEIPDAEEMPMDDEQEPAF